MKPTQSFKETLRQLFEIYLATERQFLEFDQLVPHDRNPPGVYSPVLYNVLQSAGSQTDGLMKVLCKEMELKPTSDNFPARYDVMNVGRLLPFLKVLTRRSLRVILPFDAKPPAWWAAYNDSKHELPSGLTSVNLEKTMTALGGVYCLLLLRLLCATRDHPRSYVMNRVDFPGWILDANPWADLEEEIRTDPHTPVKVERDGASVGLGLPSNLAPMRFVDRDGWGLESELFDIPVFCLPLLDKELKPWSRTDVWQHIKQR